MCHHPACSWSHSKRRQGQCRVQRTPQSRASPLGSPASEVIQAMRYTLSSVVAQRSFPRRPALLVFKTLKQALRTSGDRIWYFTKSPSACAVSLGEGTAVMVLGSWRACECQQRGLESGALTLCTSVPGWPTARSRACAPMRSPCQVRGHVGGSGVPTAVGGGPVCLTSAHSYEDYVFLG